jgi:hypothetical protein
MVDRSSAPAAPGPRRAAISGRSRTLAVGERPENLDIGQTAIALP